MSQTLRNRFDFSRMNNQSVLWLLIALAVTSLGISFFAHFITADVTWTEWIDGAFQNFSTEMIGAIVTFGLFELILGARQREDDRAEVQQREEQQRGFITELNEQQRKFLEEVNQRTEEQNRKVIQANAIARLRQAKTPEQRQPIVDEMKELDLLRGAELGELNLSGVNLRQADLSHANLRYADLSDTNLFDTNLSGSNLNLAHLSGANLKRSRLTNANLSIANLSGATLVEADLSGAILEGSILSGAVLRNAKLYGVQWGTTTLPDGMHWTSETDMTQFLNSSHPEYIATLAQVNMRRLEQGRKMVGMQDRQREWVYPLVNNYLDGETMLERVNARRAELGLDPLT